MHITDAWGAERPGADAALMIALHARRSAASVAAWHAAFPERPLVLVLTGTDLYRDIETDADAQRSLALAQRLVVLNEAGPARLPPALRDRVTVCLQSATPRRASRCGATWSMRSPTWSVSWSPPTRPGPTWCWS